MLAKHRRERENANDLTIEVDTNLGKWSWPPGIQATRASPLVTSAVL